MIGREPAYLMLEDGARFDGLRAGASEAATGEVVFNTAMTGYQEAVTDPSYRGQIITYTYPMIGNYGVAEALMESGAPHARAVVMREITPAGERSVQGDWERWLIENSVTAITGVDTRSLVRHIRDKGAMRGGIFPGGVGAAEALETIFGEPPMRGRDLAGEVTPAQPVIFGDGDGPRVVAIDTGIKRSIIENLRKRGVRLELHPCGSSAADLFARDPDIFFLANGPGDPAALEYVVDTVRRLIGVKPVFGICLGHQLMCRAIGLETYKLPFGHRGANHPVKDLASGKIDITAQNHGFAVQTPDGSGKITGEGPVRWETDFGSAELSHVNLYDHTVEGLVLRDVAGATVQYHPEGGPGPHDALYLFDRFLALAERAR
ncbi:MAG: glutamine-hydrolyzing carbamoyl-phosphate synthase small subunit [Solirubrobacterales bacterium]